MKRLLNHEQFIERIAKPQHMKLEGSGDAYIRYIQKYVTDNNITSEDELQKKLLPDFRNQDEYDIYYNMSGPFITEAFEDLN